MDFLEVVSNLGDFLSSWRLYVCLILSIALAFGLAHVIDNKWLEIAAGVVCLFSGFAIGLYWEDKAQ